jgi:hypothetical protein
MTVMEGLRVYHLIGIEGGVLLLVYHTNARAYQFRLIRPDGAVMGEGKIYYTADAALREGLKWAGR